MSQSNSTHRAEVSMSKARLIISYACLVGVPLLGLLGIFRAGQSLSAPPSLGGSWYLEADLGNLANGPCRELLGRVTQPFMTISQSGANLQVAINNPEKTTLPGTVEGAAVAVNPEDTGKLESATTCSDTRDLRLAATVVGKGNRRVLQGQLGIAGCAACPQIEFRAVRKIAEGKGAL